MQVLALLPVAQVPCLVPTLIADEPSSPDSSLLEFHSMPLALPSVHAYACCPGWHRRMCSMYGREQRESYYRDSIIGPDPAVGVTFKTSRHTGARARRSVPALRRRVLPQRWQEVSGHLPTPLCTGTLHNRFVCCSALPGREEVGAPSSGVVKPVF